MRFAANSCCPQRWSSAGYPKVRNSKPSARERAWLWRLRDDSKTTSTADFFISTRCVSSSSVKRTACSTWDFFPQFGASCRFFQKNARRCAFPRRWKDMVRIVKDYLRNAVRLSFGSTSKPSENVRVQAFEVAMDRKQEMLQRLLTKETGKCLVFARTKRGTERIAESLNRKGFSAAMIHGDRSQSQRTSALTGFQQGRFRVLVATDLASRGIHVQDIAHVINYDLPEVAENFIHRVGRTGRNGGHGVASTLFVKEQRSELFHLERSLGIKIERMRADETTSLPEKQERSPVNVPGPQDRKPVNLPRVESARVQERFVLPGEVFQTQLEN